MVLPQGMRSPEPAGSPSLQLLPSANEIAGKEVMFEVNAPDRADPRKLLAPLHAGEQGLLRKAIDEEKRRTIDGKPDSKNVYLSRFQEKFNTNPAEEWNLFLSQRGKTEIDADVQAVIELIEKLSKAIDEENVDNMQNFKQQFDLFGRNVSLGHETEQALSRLINTITNNLGDLAESKKEAREAIARLHKQQITIKQEVLEGFQTDWDNLSPESQAAAEMAYYRYCWDMEDGTIARNMELKVLTTHRTGAPHMVLDGRERHIYPAILAWRELDAQLKTTDNPLERYQLEHAMKEQEEIVARWSSAFTGTFNNRFELGPTAVPQVKNGSWDEIKYTIDKLRENPDGTGDVKKSFVYANATFEQGSWEAIMMKSEIFTQFGLAKNALKLLNQIDEDTFASLDYGPDLNSLLMPTDRQDIIDRRKKKEHLRSLKEEQENLNKKVVESERTITELEGTKSAEGDTKIVELEKRVRKASKLLDKHGPGAAGGGGGGGGRVVKGGGGGKSNSLVDNLNNAQSQLDAARKRLQEAIEEKEAAEKRLEKLFDSTTGTGEIPTAEDELVKLNNKIEHQKRVAKGEEAPDPTKLEAKLRPIYSKLKKKLEKFINQGSLSTDLYDLLDNTDVKLLAKLLGIQTNLNERKDRHTFGFNTANDCDNDALGFKSDYAFIDLGQILNQSGRISPNIIQEALDHPERFPELKNLMDKLKSENKIVIVNSFSVTDDLDGGIIERQNWGTGREYNQERAEELMKERGWSSVDLFKHWLDDLDIQRQLGVRPEEMEERYMSWVAQNHLLRQKHFKADDGWTFINTNVPTSTTNYFESTVRRMVDANLELTSHGFRQLPLGQHLGRSNEYAVTITDHDNSRQVLYRNQDLSERDGAPKTMAERLFQSIKNKLQLYHQRTQIGGQSIVNPAMGAGADFDKIGAFVQANLDMIEQKMMTLQAIYDDPTTDHDTMLKRLLDFRNNELIHISYDLFDENGDFVPENANPELMEYYDATSQWLGKLKRNMREAEERYAYTVTNDNATAADIQKAQTDYIYHLGQRRNFEVKQNLLGMQAMGQLTDKSNKEIGAIIGNRHAKIGAEGLRRIAEHSFRAEFNFDQDEKRGLFNMWGTRIVGKLAKNKVADIGRRIGRTMGLGDRFLREVDQDTIAAQIRKKMDTEIIKRAAAHTAFSVKTHYQNSWGGIFAPEMSELLYDEENTGGILGNINAPGVNLSPTGEAYMRALEHRIAEDVGDAIDRTIGNNMHVMIKAVKNRGWDINQIMKTYQDAGMNDKQRVVGGYYDMYSKEPTKISMLEEAFLQELSPRMRRDSLSMSNPSPTDTNYGPYNESPTPMINQYPDLV